MNLKDKQHLQWIYDRMVEVHNENPDRDYMVEFRNILKDIDEAGNKEIKDSNWLQTTKEGRYLLNKISFPIANHFKTHPEKIPLSLITEIINSVNENVVIHSNEAGKTAKDTIREIASIAWKGAANAYRMYPDNKHTFSDYWAGAKDQFKEYASLKVQQSKANVTQSDCEHKHR